MMDESKNPNTETLLKNMAKHKPLTVEYRSSINM